MYHFDFVATPFLLCTKFSLPLRCSPRISRQKVCPAFLFVCLFLLHFSIFCWQMKVCLQFGLFIPTFLLYFCMLLFVKYSALFLDSWFLRHILLIPCFFLPPFWFFFAAYFVYSLLIPTLFLTYFSSRTFCCIFCLFLPYAWLIPTLFLIFSFLQHILLIPALFLPYSLFIRTLLWDFAFGSIFCLFLHSSWLIPGLFQPYFRSLFSAAFFVFSCPIFWTLSFCSIFCFFLPYSCPFRALFLEVLFSEAYPASFLLDFWCIPAFFLEMHFLLHNCLWNWFATFWHQRAHRKLIESTKVKFIWNVEPLVDAYCLGFRYTRVWKKQLPLQQALCPGLTLSDPGGKLTKHITMADKPCRILCTFMPTKIANIFLKEKTYTLSSPDSKCYGLASQCHTDIQPPTTTWVIHWLGHLCEWWCQIRSPFFSSWCLSNYNYVQIIVLHLVIHRSLCNKFIPALFSVDHLQ